MKKRVFRLFGVADFSLRFLISVLILSMQCQLVRADNYYGMPNDYLQYGAGARSLAMGGAYVALADEASAPYWNPAALTQIEEHQFLSMYAPFFEKTSYSFMSYIHLLGRLGSLAISDVLIYSGGYEEVDKDGNVIGRNKSICKNAVIISYGNRVHRRISLGASLKLIYERVMKYSGSGQGMDLGILCRPLDRLSIGLAVQNVLEPKVTLRYDPNVYKLNLKAGMALNALSKRLTLTADINKLVDEKAYFAVGAEISPWEKISGSSLNSVDLRLGFNHLQAMTVGIGLNIKSLSLDYAYSPHKIGNLHRFGLTFRWGSIYKATVKPILNSENTYWLGESPKPLKFSTQIPSIAVKKWTLNIKNESGEVVRSFGSRRFTPKIIGWNLCDGKGRPVKDGDYSYEFTVIYKNDRQWVDWGEIKLHTFLSQETPIEMR